MRTKLYFLLPVLALVLALGACGPSSGSQNRTLTVSGNGTVYLTPDIAYIYVGVHTEDADIAKALAENNMKAQNVINALTNMGVAAEDIQTSSFNIYSNQKYNPVDGQPSGYTYVVDNTVYITVRDLARLGELLNKAVSSGANNINSIQFDVADKTAALAQARQKAVENARTLANELAQTAGVTLGEIQTVSFSDYYPSPYYGVGGGPEMAAAFSVPIQPGKLQISVSVSVTYALR